MPQSLSRILIHIVFSVKQRAPLLEEAIRRELYAYLAGVLKQLESPALKIGGTADHVHILCLLSRSRTVAKIVEEFKTGSSKWLKTKRAQFQTFHWQNGYGAFSVSESVVDAVIQYIERQEEHHRRMSFQEEYRKLLEKHRIPYDERYVWE
jgi:REP element-mobilizing transposase RayT